MSDAIDSARERLNTYDVLLVQEFAQVADSLVEESSVSEIVEEWAQLCADIASRGWHTWESSLAFIRITLPLYRGQNHSEASHGGRAAAQQLLECGRYALRLAGNSHEVSSAYLNALGVISGSENNLVQDSWQQLGNLIQKTCPRSSALLLNYYELSSVIGSRYQGDDFLAWLQVIDRLTSSGSEKEDASKIVQESLQSLFHTCKRYPADINWGYGALVPVTLIVEFFGVYPRIKLWTESELRVVCQVIDAMSENHSDASEFLKLTATRITSYPSEQRQTITNSCLRLALHRYSPVLAFLNSIDQLPVMQPELLYAWIEKGEQVGGSSEQIADAYFRLESATSIEVLHSLKGQVNFDEQRRLFHLYSEGITGKKLQIEISATPDQEFRGYSATRTDGQHVYLPDQISTFDERSKNASLYKLSLLHQLGFFESGTFEYSASGSPNAFGDFFSGFIDPSLASMLFQILEDGRVDWFLLHRYKGIRKEMNWLMAYALSNRPVPGSMNDPVKDMLELMVQYTLGASNTSAMAPELPVQQVLETVSQLQKPGATVYDTIDAVTSIYSMISGNREIDADRNNQHGDAEPESMESAADGDSQGFDWMPEPVEYRGSTNPEGVSLKMALQEIEDAIADMLDDQGADGASSLIDAANLKIEQITKGDIDNASGMFLTDIADQLADASIDQDELEESLEELSSILQLEKKASREVGVFKYDEWDYHITDYRKNWCKLHEIVPDSDDEVFVNKTLDTHKSLLTQIKKQLQMLKPELQRKVKGLLDGEEIDLEGAIEAIIDKKSGISPTDKIYIQRQRKERDVSALFLLDMSASTDDALPDLDSQKAGGLPDDLQPAARQEEEDDFLFAHYSREDFVLPAKKRRIIDLEKESVVLMAEALEELGDSYAISGFSGYGRDQVDYYVCKDFNEHYHAEVKGRIGAIKPCRSTRMGPAIRHATRELAKTESRIKALIIISDGYPQDFDYGSDRNSREYGMQDTSKALNEAKQKGVQTFCLTVDQSGHDYLRDMCPDQQYMVIQDLNQLPKELSKVYQGLTT